MQYGKHIMLFKAGSSDKGRRAALVSFLVSGLSALLPSAALAATTVSLAWDPSASTNAAGYKIHYGVVSRTYTNTVAVGNTTNTTISGLVDGVTYYFAATTLDGSGLESDVWVPAAG